MRDSLVELHFIDGPYQGQRKNESKDLIRQSRYYRLLVPFKMTEEKDLQGNVKCWAIACEYYPIPLPPAYGVERFAMVLKGAME